MGSCSFSDESAPACRGPHAPASPNSHNGRVCPLVIAASKDITKGRSKSRSVSPSLSWAPTLPWIPLALLTSHRLGLGAADYDQVPALVRWRAHDATVQSPITTTQQGAFVFGRD